MVERLEGHHRHPVAPGAAPRALPELVRHARPCRCCSRPTSRRSIRGNLLAGLMTAAAGAAAGAQADASSRAGRWTGWRDTWRVLRKEHPAQLATADRAGHFPEEFFPSHAGGDLLAYRQWLDDAEVALAGASRPRCCRRWPTTRRPSPGSSAIGAWLDEHLAEMKILLAPWLARPSADPARPSSELLDATGDDWAARDRVLQRDAAATTRWSSGASEPPSGRPSGEPRRPRGLPREGARPGAGRPLRVARRCEPASTG